MARHNRKSTPPESELKLSSEGREHFRKIKESLDRIPPNVRAGAQMSPGQIAFFKQIQARLGRVPEALRGGVQVKLPPVYHQLMERGRQSVVPEWVKEAAQQQATTPDPDLERARKQLDQHLAITSGHVAPPWAKQPLETLERLAANQATASESAKLTAKVSTPRHRTTPPRPITSVQKKTVPIARPRPAVSRKQVKPLKPTEWLRRYAEAHPEICGQGAAPALREIHREMRAAHSVGRVEIVIGARSIADNLRDWELAPPTRPRKKPA